MKHNCKYLYEQKSFPCLNPLNNIFSSVGLNKMFLHYAGQAQFMNQSSVNNWSFSEILRTIAQHGHEINTFSVNELGSIMLLLHAHKGSFYVHWAFLSTELVRTLLLKNERSANEIVSPKMGDILSNVNENPRNEQFQVQVGGNPAPGPW